ncbi:MAG: AAA family ATPase [Anaerolineaceae bacterium]|nr:AAA family ATPase [Anaerolineaceae bacterium]MCY3934908.1 AAA family ATPase [Chloroflexota bacterium]
MNETLSRKGQNMANSDKLHLPDLTVKGFRGIEDLSISRLGRVTLLTGKNSVGKTTVLEAVRTYAARGRSVVLTNILEGREEYSDASDEDGDLFPAPDLAALFFGRTPSMDSSVSIGQIDDIKTLKILHAPLTSLSDEQLAVIERLSTEISPESNVQVLKVIFQQKELIIPWLVYDQRGRYYSPSLRRIVRRVSSENEFPSELTCISLGPGLLSNAEITNYWDNVVLTPAEDQAVQALGLIFGTAVSRVALVSDRSSSYRRNAGRRAIVKLTSHEQPVPLRSLGDGASRLFSVALALANCSDGFLLIDEAENGIHHTIQPGYWRLVIEAALQNNVQVLATTHSDDCVKSFAQAANENEDADCVLVRLEKDEKGIYAVEYSEESLQTAADFDIETR